MDSGSSLKDVWGDLWNDSSSDKKQAGTVKEVDNTSKDKPTEGISAPSAPTDPVLSTDLENLPWNRLPGEGDYEGIHPVNIPKKIAELKGLQQTCMALGEYVYVIDTDGWLKRSKRMS